MLGENLTRDHQRASRLASFMRVQTGKRPWDLAALARIPDSGLLHLMCGDRGPQARGCALNYFAYNFMKFHRTLRMSPAWPLALRIGSGA